MARSMTQRRQEVERERIAAYDAVLKRVRRAPRQAPDFRQALDDASRGFAGEAIRDKASWRPKMKTRNAARLRLAAARHLFARFPVSSALEAIWLGDAGLAPDEVRLRKRWYIVVARGRSLYKEGAGEWLTRKEVHRFLNPPGELGFDAAFWCAVALTYTGDIGHALRIARSKIRYYPRAQIAFWREAARFFAVNAVALEEINDLCDFLAAKRRGDRGWSLKGRTLGSLRRAMHEWHRDAAIVARIEAARQRAAAAANGNRGPVSQGGSWKGSPLANWEWTPSAKRGGKAREKYVVAQLLTADSLVVESRAMRHCVWTYASKCIAGNASVWSLRYHADGGMTRLLTIELDRNGRAVQVRGFANRTAKPDERSVLTRWAKARGVAIV
ncbi:MAG: PcfJ domain-containing protein [Brucellaceae bacterium]|nr:PcfJ domain-containing protein [Brucellaceae bacterium]